MSDSEVLTGVLHQIVYRAEESDFKILRLRTGETIKGQLPDSELIVGMTFQFQGEWKLETKLFRGQRQKSFWANRIKRSEPHTRQGVTRYLSHIASGIGPGLAASLFDEFGDKAVQILRTNPEEASRRVKYLPLDVALSASDSLKRNEKTEEVRIDLMELFSGRGFSHALPGHVIQRWGIEAAKVIRRDPFSLLIHGFESCGFLRCDQLYMDLDRRPWRLKRLMLCIWHFIRSAQDGHTWHDATRVIAHCRQNATVSEDFNGPFGTGQDRILKAIELGCRSGWLAMYRDDDRKIWIAEGAASRNELTVANCIANLIAAGSHKAIAEDSEAMASEGFQRRLDVAVHRISNENRTGEDVFTPRRDKAAMIADGLKTGICQFCARTLKTDESRRRGYGPVCAKNHGLPWDGPSSGVDEEESSISGSVLDLLVSSHAGGSVDE